MTWVKFLRLPHREKIAVMRVLGVVFLVQTGLRVLPADRLARLLGVPLQLSDADAAPPAGAGVISDYRRPELRMLGPVLARLPFRRRSSCLTESLSTGFFLRHMQPRLRLGVGRAGEAVLAHAWVEAANHSFFADAAFRPLGQRSNNTEP
jgi:Transglutaminase-like superfamily